MTKIKIVTLISTLSIASFSQAGMISSALSGGTINNTVNAARDVALKRKSSIKYTNVKMDSECKVRQGIVWGTCGIDFSASEVDMRNSTFRNRVDINQGAVIGTAGIGGNAK